MEIEELVRYLDEFLAIDQTPDYKPAHNGLQVEGRRQIHKIAVAVDACLATIGRAVASDADLLITHHGLFWGKTAPLTGTYYRRVELLVKNDLPLYSCHLPLDAHLEVGNCAVLARMLGLELIGRFGWYEGAPIGVRAEADLTREELVERVRAALDIEPLLIATGPERCVEIGVVTGGAGDWICQAADEGLDTYITGEGAHHTYFDAEERGINVIYAGHYATETVGVKALAAHLAERFGLETLFLDHPTGL